MAGFEGLSGNGSEAGGYERYEMLGKGSYGAVYRGVHNQTGEVVALKVYHFGSRLIFEIL